LIIMEDMTPTAVTITMLPGMNDEQTVSMIDELATLHVTSWKHPEWMDTIKNLERSEQFMEFSKKMSDTLKKIKPEWFEELVDKLAPIYNIDVLDDVAYEEDRFGFPASVVHGDLWASNILWKKNENGEATSEVEAVIDWQMIHSGNPCEDIARLLSLNTSGTYRRANTKKTPQAIHRKGDRANGWKASIHIRTDRRSLQTCNAIHGHIHRLWCTDVLQHGIGGRRGKRESS